ncbi:MAG: hypothetical protein QM775_06105 [Pirellulales bacterium]
MIVHSSDGVFAIRRGPWKYVEGVPAVSLTAAVRKRKAAELKPQLFRTQDDPGETSDVAAKHPEVVADLHALLVRYRDGGYSRELPPVVPPKAAAAGAVIALPPLDSEILIDKVLSSVGGDKVERVGEPWKVAGAEYWSEQATGAERPSGLRISLPEQDVVLEYEVNFRGAGRHSLRIDCEALGASFRCEVSLKHCGITKNPPRGADKREVEPLARKPLELSADRWYPVRVTLRGHHATLQVNDAVLDAENPIIGEVKQAANILMFGDGLGVRNVRLRK